MFAQEDERKVSITCVDTKQRKLCIQVLEASSEERLDFRGVWLSHYVCVRGFYIAYKQDHTGRQTRATQAGG